MKICITLLMVMGLLLSCPFSLAQELPPAAVPTVSPTAAPYFCKREPCAAFNVSATLPSGVSFIFPARDYAAENDHFSIASENALPLEQALAIACQALMDSHDETPQTLLRFELWYGYQSNAPDFETPYWQFDFCGQEPSDRYEIIVHAEHGNVLYLAGPNEGNG